ncbi:bacteriophage-related lipoprotein [Betaproteobacteria bacterium]|nr:bacteriophage-related lipoprotein [Betaproteobacteria bacterium]
MTYVSKHWGRARGFFFFLIFPAMVQAATVDDFSMDFVDVDPRELIRLVYGEFLRESYVIESNISETVKPVSLRLRGMSYITVEALLVDLLKGQGIEVRRSGGVVVVGKQDDSKLEPETMIYRPKYRPSSYLQQAMSAVFPSGAFPNQRPGGMPFTGLGAPPAGTSTPSRQGYSVHPASSSSGSYSSGVNVLTEYDSDVLVFMGMPADIKRFQALVAELDRPTGEVMVKAIVYEVRHEQREGSAIDLAASILSGRLDIGLSAGVVDSSAISFKFQNGSSSINAIYSALSSDERFRVVSSPRVRVRSGSTARLSVGDDVPILSSVSYDGSDRPIQSVEYKSSGVIFELTPKVRELVVDLKVNQQISSFIATTTGVDASPTLTKRELTTELTLSSDDDVVVIGGLEQDSNTEGNRGLSFFPDWLRSDQTDTTKSEILLMLHVQRL